MDSHCAWCYEEAPRFQMRIDAVTTVVLCSPTCQKSLWLLVARHGQCPLVYEDLAEHGNNLSEERHVYTTHNKLAAALYNPEPIGFQLSLHTGIVGTAMNLMGVEQNMVHQRITQDSLHMLEDQDFGGQEDYFRVLQRETSRDGAAHLTGKRLIEGVLWNDMPIKDGATPVKKVDCDDARVYILSNNHYRSKLCLSDDRVSYSPTLFAMMRTALVFVCPWASRIVNGTCINESHTGDKCHWHAMTSRAEAQVRGYSIATKRDKIVDQAQAWFGKAVACADVFYIGNILHMIQDSYSPAHVTRRFDDEMAHSIITEFCVVNHDDTRAHTEMDKMHTYDDMDERFKNELHAASALCLRLFREALADRSAVASLCKTLGQKMRNVYFFTGESEERTKELNEVMGESNETTAGDTNETTGDSKGTTSSITTGK